jgi:hypothetical protein
MSPSDVKTISQFSPSAAVGRESADRYYREVHSRFARRTLRAMEHVLTYHTAIAAASYDLNSGWNAPPETFRYVTLRFRAGHALGFSPEVREQVTQDHRRFLRDLRSFGVEEEVRVDRVDGQTTTVKYLFEYDRAPAEDRDTGATRLDEQLGRLTTLAEHAFGLRRLVLDRVVSESVAAALDEPGQAPTGEVLASSSRHAFVEVYFDHRDWAEDWFALPDVRSALLGSGWARVHGIRVQEECGLDRRG